MQHVAVLCVSTAGKIIESNQLCCELLGLECSSAAGKSFESLFDKPFPRAFPWNQVGETSLPRECELRRNGFVLTAVFVPTGPDIVVLFPTPGWVLPARLALLESESRSFSFSVLSNGVLTECSGPGLASLLGFPATEVLGKSMEDILMRGDGYQSSQKLRDLIHSTGLHRRSTRALDFTLCEGGTRQLV